MADIIASYGEGNKNYDLNCYGTTVQAAGETFPGNGQQVVSCKFYLQKYGFPTGYATADLYAITGTYGSSAVPTGSSLSTSNAIDIAGLATDYVLVEFTFPTPYTTANGTYYCIVYTNPTATTDSSNFIRVGADSDSLYAGNITRKLVGGWGVMAGYDACFYVYGEDAPATTGKNLLLLGVG